MNGIHVDPAQMDALGKKTINSSADLDSQIKSLTSNKDSLIAIWTGNSSTAFDRAVQMQIKNLNAFKDLINELGQKITTGANTFYTNEEENANDAKNLYPDNNWL